MRKLFLVIVVLLISAPALAQQASPTDKFTWDQVGANLAQVQGYRYEVEMDGGAPATVTTTCTGTASPFTCSAPIPAVTPASHTARIRAVDISVPATPMAGGFSLPFTFTMRAVPGVPLNIRIVPGS